VVVTTTFLTLLAVIYIFANDALVADSCNWTHLATTTLYTLVLNKWLSWRTVRDWLFTCLIRFLTLSIGFFLTNELIENSRRTFLELFLNDTLDYTTRHISLLNRFFTNFYWSCASFLCFNTSCLSDWFDFSWKFNRGVDDTWAWNLCADSRGTNKELNFFVSAECHGVTHVKIWVILNGDFLIVTVYVANDGFVTADDLSFCAH